jgi:hypothetical protein
MPQYHSGTGILIVSITAEVMSQYHSGTGILIVSINADVMSQYHSGTGILILRGAVLTGLQDTQQKAKYELPYANSMYRSHLEHNIPSLAHLSNSPHNSFLP